MKTDIDLIAHDGAVHFAILARQVDDPIHGADGPQIQDNVVRVGRIRSVPFRMLVGCRVTVQDIASGRILKLCFFAIHGYDP